MKIRTMNPAAITASPRVNRYDTLRDMTIRIQRIIYDPTELITCHQLRKLSGLLYLDMILIHSGLLPAGLLFFSILIFISLIPKKKFQCSGLRISEYKDTNYYRKCQVCRLARNAMTIKQFFSV